MKKKSSGILLAKPRVQWNKQTWRDLPKVSRMECDKAERPSDPKELKASNHTCVAGKERGQRTRKSWGSGSRNIKRDLSRDKFYGE